METQKPRSFLSLTIEEINKALETAIKDQIIEGKVILLTEEWYDKALAFAREYFLKDEPICKALGVQWTDELANSWFLSVFQLNLTLILVNPQNDDIIALRSTTISKRGTRLNLDDFKDGGLRKAYGIVKVTNEAVKFNERYDVDEAVHYFGLAVHREYRDHGIASKFVQLHLHFLKHLGISPLIVKVEASSNYSKRLFENLGFEALYELKYEDYVVDGEHVLRNTGEHKSIKTYGLKVC